MSSSSTVSTSGVYNTYSEHNLSINEFNKPKVDVGIQAVLDKIVQLIMMKPGTYPTRPYMGIGLIENYRYTFTDDIGKLNDEVSEQVKTYLPEFYPITISFDTSASEEKVLYIYITYNNNSYAAILNTETKSLEWLSNSTSSGTATV